MVELRTLSREEIIEIESQVLDMVDRVRRLNQTLKATKASPRDSDYVGTLRVNVGDLKVKCEDMVINARRLTGK